MVRNISVDITELMKQSDLAMMGRNWMLVSDFDVRVTPLID